MESRRGLQRQSMLPRIRFRYIAEPLINRSSLVPIWKLIGVVPAPGLTGLAAGNEHDGLVPVCQVGLKAHGWTVMFRCGTRAVCRAGLRPVRDAEKKLQQPCVPQRMHDVQRIKLLPGEIVDARFVAYFREAHHATL